MATGNLSKVAKTTGGALTLVLTYLGVAIAADWPPFNPTANISIDFPGNGYQFSKDFTAELSGSLASQTHLWLAAIDSNQRWYPLGEAAASSEGHWRASIRAEQILSEVDLCAVTVDTPTNDSFRDYARRGQSLPRLPAESNRLTCARIRPTQ